MKTGREWKGCYSKNETGEYNAFLYCHLGRTIIDDGNESTIVLTVQISFKCSSRVRAWVFSILLCHPISGTRYAELNIYSIYIFGISDAMERIIYGYSTCEYMCLCVEGMHDDCWLGWFSGWAYNCTISQNIPLALAHPIPVLLVPEFVRENARREMNTTLGGSNEPRV